MVEYLKHNLLSVGKMCDQGYNLIFNSIKCEIREEDSRRLVATTTRNPHNIYILDIVKKKRIEAKKRKLRTTTKKVNKYWAPWKKCEFKKNNPKKKKEQWLKTCRKGRSYPFPLMSKREIEKEKKHDDRGRMSVVINEKGGYYWMRLSLMSKVKHNPYAGQANPLCKPTLTKYKFMYNSMGQT